MTEWVWLTDADDWGEGFTEKDHEALNELAEEWLSDHEGVHLSISVRSVFGNQIAELYEILPNGNWQIMGGSFQAPEEVNDLIYKAWEYALETYSSNSPEVRAHYKKEGIMTHRRPPERRRRALRRRADARRIRERVRDRLERRARAQAEREEPRREARRVPSRRIAEMREERDRRRRLARLEELREERQRKERVAERIEARRRARRREERLARLEELREERQRKERLAELRAARQERKPAPEKKEASPSRKAPEAPKKRIYVKADNSAGVPAGYYELDEKATRALQAKKRREAAAAAAKKREEK